MANLLKTKSLLINLLLITLPINSSLCIDMYLPAYSSIANTFHTTQGTINLSMSLYLFGLAVGQVFYGAISDKYGRKRVLICGMLLFIFSSIFIITTKTLFIFLVARFFQAIGACSSIVLTRAIVADSFHPEKRTSMLALISAANIFSPALAPLFGGIILTWFNWRYIFLSIALFGLIMLIGIIFLLQETLTHPNPHSLEGRQLLYNTKRLFSSRLFMGYVFSLSSLYALVFVWVTLSPNLIITILGILPKNFGFYFLMPATGSALGAILTAKYNRFFRIKNQIRNSLLLILIAIIVLNIFIFTHQVFSPLFIVIPMMFVFFGAGSAAPLLTSESLSLFLDINGFASGMIGLIQISAGALMGMITSYFYNNAEIAMGSLTFTGIMFAFFFFFLTTLHRKTTDIVPIA